MKVLVVRFSSIGDIVLTTPVIRCLKAQYPNAEVHFATKSIYHQVLKENPNVDCFHLLGASWKEFIEPLKQHNFHWVFDLHKNIRTQKLKSAIRFNKAYSYNKQNINKWILVNAKINRLKNYSVVDSYFNSLPLKYDGNGLDFFLDSKKDYAHISQIETEFKFIAIVLGAKHKTKQLPANRLSELIGSIKQPIVLLGGNTEENLAQEVLKKNGSGVLNLVSKLTLDESAYVLSKADKVISHDTGLMHIASAFSKKMAVVWGNTTRDLGFAPVYPRGNKNVTHFEVEGLKCRPCSKLGHAKCPKGHFKCMNNQDFASLALWANQ